jgi:hypothetical protein
MTFAGLKLVTEPPLTVVTIRPLMVPALTAPKGIVTPP